MPFIYVFLAATIFAPCALAGDVTSNPDPPRPKTIVLGIDGLDHALVTRFMAEGLLPNLSRLGSEGSFRPLQTSNPAQSPVSWSVFNTGSNPGKTGVPGFVTRYFERDADGKRVGIPLPQPMLGFPTELAVENSIGFDRVPYEINPMQGTNWWSHLDRAGVRMTGIQIAATSPPDDEGPNTRLLSGLGVKDIGGSPGTWYVYTDDPWSWSHGTNTAGKIVKFTLEGDRADMELFGPRNWIVGFDFDDRIQALEDVLVDAVGPDRTPLENQLNEVRSEFNAWSRIERDTKATVYLTVDRDAGTVTFELQGTHVTVRRGEWSQLLPVEFALTESYSEHGVVRFHVLVCDEKEVRIFVPAINRDPRHPPEHMPISAPLEFSAELAHGLGGLYETLGWASSTNPLKDIEDSEFGAQSFLDHVGLILDGRERLLAWNLDHSSEWDVYYQVLSTPDRVAHMLYREFDTGHPAHDAEYAGKMVTAWGRTFPLSRAMAEIYREADRLVGDVMLRVESGEFGSDCLLLVLSDHGFTSFRRGVNLNNLLLEHGYLALKGGQGLEEVLEGRAAYLLTYVDWSQTRAYSLGLGKVYINRKGREPFGIVGEDDVPSLIEAIRRDLLDVTDGPGGARVVTSVSHRDELFSGPWVAEGTGLVQRVAGTERRIDHWDGFADLFVGFAPGYRVSWATTLGGLDPETISDNVNHWSGDHVSVDPSHLPGVLLCNRAWDGEAGAGIMDIGPTILQRYGIDPTQTEMDGRPLPLAESPSR